MYAHFKIGFGMELLHLSSSNKFRQKWLGRQVEQVDKQVDKLVGKLHILE